MKHALASCLLLLVLSPAALAAKGDYLYRARLVQATPGKFVELLDLLGRESAGIVSGGEASPFIMRHSQGDPWDLMLIYPVGNCADYYNAERVGKRKKG